VAASGKTIYHQKKTTQMTSNDILIIFYSEQKTGKLNVSVIMNTLGTLLKCQNEKKRENVLEEKSISCGKSFVCAPVYNKKFHSTVILKRKLTKLIKTLPTFRSVLIKKSFQFFIAFFIWKTR
jgi:hypothetical protein